MQKLISWKHSFRRLNEEYELAKKKKQALGSLLSSGKISQATYNLFNREIDDATEEIESQRKSLLEKMASKTMELEEQVKTLEILLANFEIQHVTGEIGEEVYQRETELLSMGLETTRQELDIVQEAANQLSNEDVVAHQNIDPQTEANESPQPEVRLLEEPVPVPTSEKEPSEPKESVVEKIQPAEGAQPLETEAKNEEKQEPK